MRAHDERPLALAAENQELRGDRPLPAARVDSSSRCKRGAILVWHPWQLPKRTPGPMPRNKRLVIRWRGTTFAASWVRVPSIVIEVLERSEAPAPQPALERL